jgi:hypothetical protein
MLMGQNLDVSYRGRTVHIQTEDLGRQVNKVMTQVFHSGAIMDTRTVSYAEEIGRLGDVQEQNEYIRRMMLALHKHFYNQIVRGTYDAKLGLPPLTEEERPSTGVRPAMAAPPQSPPPTADAVPSSEGMTEVVAELRREQSPRPPVQAADSGVSSDTTGMGFPRGGVEPPQQPASPRMGATLRPDTRAFRGAVDVEPIDAELRGSLLVNMPFQPA